MTKLDAIDKQILRILQENAHTNVKELAAQLNLTKTPVYERIKRYEQAGIIEKYVAILDPNKLGNSMVVFCSVSLESQKLEALELFSQSIEKIPEVIECYLMGGSSDFLLKVIVEDLQACHQFASGKLAALPYVSEIKSTFVLNEVKRSNAIPIK